MKKHMIKTPSTMGKEQLLLLKRSMNKKSYKAYCKKYRNTITLGRNYGTRKMLSARDVQHNNRIKVDQDFGC